MNQHICISSDGRSKVSVKRHCKSIMKHLRYIEVSQAKVYCLVHTSSGHNPNNLVEVGIVRSHCFVKTVSKTLRSVQSDLIPKFL